MSAEKAREYKGLANENMEVVAELTLISMNLILSVSME
jgi:hypothetical protein